MQKKKRILLSLTLLTSMFAQLTAPIAIYAVEEGEDLGTVNTDTPTEETSIDQKTDIDEQENAENLTETANDTDNVNGDGTDGSPGQSDSEGLDGDIDNVEDNDTTDDSSGQNGSRGTDDDSSDEIDNEDKNESEEDENAGSDEEFGLFQADVDPFELAVMHMNDTHARVENFTRIVTAANTFREANPEALFLHAGDVFSGTLYFNEFQGEADLALMKLMGIDAMVFGNHEFDLGDSDDGHAALGDFVANANFPFLGTNINFSADQFLASYETKASLVKNPRNGAIYDSIIFNVDGEQVGVFGLTIEDTVNIASPVDVTFSDYIETARAAVAELEDAGIDKIVALTHLGYDTAPDNDLTLAQFVDGIDIIVGGHSHTALEEPVLVNESTDNPTVIAHAGQNAEHLGTLNVQFDEAGRVIEYTGELLAIADYEEDPEAVEELAIYKAAVEELNNQEIGAIAVKDLENPRHGDGDEISVRANETPLGNLVTDAMLYKAREKFPEIDFAVQNGGGIRAPISAGPITTGEVIQVLPFANDPVIAELTGQEIKELFELSLQNYPEENGGFLHVSGLKILFDSTREVGDRVVALYLDKGLDLVEIRMDETYLVTTNAFTATGGDGLTPFATANAEGRVRDIGEIDWQQLRDYMVQPQYLNGVVDPVLEGRIVDLMGEEAPSREGLIIERLINRLQDLEEDVSELASQNQVQADEIEALREEVKELKAEISKANIDIEDLEAQIAQLEARIAELEAEKEPEEDKSEEEAPEEETSDKKDSGKKKPRIDSKDKKPSHVKGKHKEDKQVSLPRTGMNMVLPLVSGATLLITGLGLETYRKKKMK